ncbi:hypothetical protein B0J11DRAFT_587021 [Dendryphion nanum]|uniref:Uncharacterized protein n=1 Tax=Dendryphion nanum TaxID=256645 RepID=A0A9P9IY24_9PLEO|nr:hypothetical protein B0J11DRAFT_587021 [Dendryphion nanum]
MAAVLTSATATMSTGSTTTTSTSTSTTTTARLKMETKKKMGLRKALKKWKEKMKTPKRLPPTTQNQLRPRAITAAAASPPPPPPPPAKTDGASPPQSTPPQPTHLSPTQAYSPSQTTDAKPFPPRSNTAPAPYSPKPATAATIRKLSSKITTLFLDFLKRPSIQPAARNSPANISYSHSSYALPSAPDRVDHQNPRATCTCTPAAEMTARTTADEARLDVAVDVIRRDKPKE